MVDIDISGLSKNIGSLIKMLPSLGPTQGDKALPEVSQGQGNL